MRKSLIIGTILSGLMATSALAQGFIGLQLGPLQLGVNTYNPGYPYYMHRHYYYHPHYVSPGSTSGCYQWNGFQWVWAC